MDANAVFGRAAVKRYRDGGGMAVTLGDGADSDRNLRGQKVCAGCGAPK